jgi:hypothetical protein
MNAAKELQRLRKRWEYGGRTQPREAKVAGGNIGMHRRWHVARGIHNPDCNLCRKAAREVKA